MNKDLKTVKEIIDFFTEYEDFNLTFIKSLKQKLEQGKELTEKQKKGLYNVKDAMDNLIESEECDATYVDIY